MFNKLLSLFRKPAAAAPAPTRATASSRPAAAESDAAPPPRWLLKSDPGNPFTVDGCDCLAFVSSMLSTTKDPEVAASFVALRSADGSAVHGALPEDAQEIACSMSYEHSGETRDGVLFRAAAMEEKWDIYLHEGRVYFCRSWTGRLALVAQITTAENGLHIARLWAPRSMDPRLATQQLDYLVKSHLYRWRVPHPLPSDLALEPRAIALYSFSQYGRLCCFGTFDDTLGQSLLKDSVAARPDA